MSREELHSVANADTPHQIAVPNTIQGLIIWAVGRFGVGILVAAAFGYATHVVYYDMRDDRRLMMDAFRDNTRVVETFAGKVSELTKSIDEAHRRAEKQP
jgi:hypothetical protein